VTMKNALQRSVSLKAIPVCLKQSYSIPVNNIPVIS